MAHSNKEIKSDYKRYEKLLNGLKESPTSEIVMEKVKSNHPNMRIEKVNLTHDELDEKLHLIVESKIENKRSFKFKLQAPEFTGEPFFRFDSDGLAHYNRAKSVPLPEQKVDTPHFNAFNSEGKGHAYQTDALKNSGQKEALLSDVSLCMAHYCDESNTFYNNNNYIEINQSPPGEFEFDLDDQNPLEGVNYE